MSPASVRATVAERRRGFPADGLLDEAIGSWTHGVTIAAPPRTVWPWLTQMGVGRAGWYSWDFLDNAGRHSAEELVEEWERVAPGDVLPATAGATDAFVVERQEPGRDLVLVVPHREGGLIATWEFLLDALPGDRTRLLVRARVSPRGWRTLLGTSIRTERVARALAAWLGRPLLALARAGHRVMQARQLRQIRRRAEARPPFAGEVGAPEIGVGGRAEAPRGRTQRPPTVIRAGNGMDIFGQGPWIMLFTAPALAAAVAAQLLAPGLVRIPLPRGPLVPPGLLLLALGAALWGTAMAQLLEGFSRGKLITTGAYGICRNPIYASFALLVLPGLSLLTGTWGYLVAGAALVAGVHLFIRNEERDLLRVFGDEYRRYAGRVHRIVPFVRPRARAG